MFEVLLHGGSVALVDDEDAERVSGLKWYRHSRGYACLSGGRELLHRFVMRCAPGDGVLVDHRNGNKLDCQKSNLRKTSYSANGFNRHQVDSRSLSGVPGVRQGKSRWYAYIFNDGKRHYLGSRDSLIEAARLRAEGEIEKYGEISPVTQQAITNMES